MIVSVVGRIWLVCYAGGSVAFPPIRTSGCRLYRHRYGGRQILPPQQLCCPEWLKHCTKDRYQERDYKCSVCQSVLSKVLSGSFLLIITKVRFRYLLISYELRTQRGTLGSCTSCRPFDIQPKKKYHIENLNAPRFMIIR